MIDRRRDRKGVSRNKWLENAVIDYLEQGEPTPCKITAEWLLCHKETVMVRLDAFTLELVNEQCEERGIPRTIWLLDACLSYMAKDKLK